MKFVFFSPSADFAAAGSSFLSKISKISFTSWSHGRRKTIVPITLVSPSNFH
jgi:hypothetical protein